MRHVQHFINALFPPFFAKAGYFPLNIFNVKCNLGCNLVELCQSRSVEFQSWLNSSKELMATALLPALMQFSEI